MLLYGVALVPLADLLLAEVPELPQPFYADDASMVGAPKDIAKAMSILLDAGPARGYYPEPEKSYLIGGPPADTEDANVLSEFQFRNVDGFRYLGGFIGAVDDQSKWVEKQVKAWVEGVKLLSQAAKRYPQAAYAGLSKSLQSEWQYLQRSTPGISHLFQPLEDVIQNEFLPALLGGTAEEAKRLRKQLALPVKLGGLAILDPCESAERCHIASLECTKLLTSSLVQCCNLCVRTHRTVVNNARITSRE